MTSITRTSSGASANIHPASASVPAPADSARTPAPGTGHAAPHGLLADRPPAQSLAGAERPRMALNSIRLSSLKKLADIPPDVATSTAATVFQQVHDGTIKLRGSYPTAALRAASVAATQGVLALQRDAARRPDPLGPTSP